MLHDNFLTALAVEGNMSGRHFVQHDPQCIDIDASTVFAPANFRCHVVKRADAFGLPAPVAPMDQFGQTIVANFDDAVIQENIAGLKITMDDSMIVQMDHARCDAAKPVHDHCVGHAIGISANNVVQTVASDVLHDDPRGVIGIVTDVVQFH